MLSTIGKPFAAIKVPVVFKTQQAQILYAGCRQVGADPSSEMYWLGRPHTGAGHRCAYWEGRSGFEESLYGRSRGAVLGYAAYRAGKDDRKIDVKLGHVCPRATMQRGPGSMPMYPLWWPATAFGLLAAAEFQSGNMRLVRYDPDTWDGVVSAFGWDFTIKDGVITDQAGEQWTALQAADRLGVKMAGPL